MRGQILSCLILSAISSGCNYTRTKISDDNSRFELPAEQKAGLSYALVAQTVLNPRCVCCHGTSGCNGAPQNPILENYASVFANIGNVKRVVFENHTMPKRGSLDDREMSILWTWIGMGAPENASGSTPIPLGPTYESINQNIFQPKCVICHSPGNPGKRILLGKDDLLNSPLELVIPGNADESGLVVAVERSDEKRMPPAKDGKAPLGDLEKQAIRDWIQNGAKD